MIYVYRRGGCVTRRKSTSSELPLILVQGAGEAVEVEEYIGVE